MSGDLFTVPAAVELLDEGVPVKGPDLMVYSTAPRVCLGSDGHDYFVKGFDDVGVVAAEAVGYTLARALEIEVPDFGVVTRADGSALFASRSVDGCIRDPAPFVAKHLSTLAKVIVLDVLLCNDDRNFGGFVAHPRRGLIALDFEKCKAVRFRYPIVELASLPRRAPWPKDALGQTARGCAVPWDFVARVERLSDTDLRSATAGVAQAVPGYTWAGASEVALKKRRDSLNALVREAWP